MLLNLLNLYSLIFALFSKIEGMSKELDSLKPTLSMNARIIPTETLDLSESFTTFLPDSCIEQKISCGPCDAQVTLPQSLADGIVLKTGSVPFLKVRPKIRRPREDLFVTSNKADKVSFENKETTTLNSILLGMKELQRLRNISIQEKVNRTNENDTTSDSADYEYTFYDTIESTTGAKTDTTFNYTNADYSSTQTDYSSSDFTTTDNSVGTELLTVTDSSETPFTNDDFNSNTDTTAYSDTTLTDIGSYDEFRSSYFNIFETTTDILDLTSKEIKETSRNEMTDTTTDTGTSLDVTDSTLKDTTDYDVIETSSSYKTPQHETTANSNTKKYNIATEAPTESTMAGVTTLNTKTIANIDICPDFTFNCTVNCNGKNVKQVFFMSNCTIVKRVCYAKICPANLGAVVDSKNGTNVTTIDFVYVDENERKMYNLSAPTKKKLLKLCWETMFGQELVKLTMMDLVRNLYCSCSVLVLKILIAIVLDNYRNCSLFILCLCY